MKKETVARLFIKLCSALTGLELFDGLRVEIRRFAVTTRSEEFVALCLEHFNARGNRIQLSPMLKQNEMHTKF